MTLVLTSFWPWPWCFDLRWPYRGHSVSRTHPVPVFFLLLFAVTGAFLFVYIDSDCYIVITLYIYSSVLLWYLECLCTFISFMIPVPGVGWWLIITHSTVDSEIVNVQNMAVNFTTLWKNVNCNNTSNFGACSSSLLISINKLIFIKEHLLVCVHLQTVCPLERNSTLSYLLL